MKNIIIIVFLLPVILFGQTFNQVGVTTVDNISQVGETLLSGVSHIGATEKASTGSYTNTKYISFGGTDEYVSIASTNYGTTFSFSAWVKGYGGAGAWFGLLGDASTYHYSWTIRIASATQRYIYLRTTSASYVTGIDTSSFWQLHTVTRSGDQVKFYINDSQVGTTQTLTNNIDFTANSINGYDATYAAFDIDELCVYNVVLTSADINSLYGGGSPETMGDPSEISGLINWWRMGDGDTYPTITDNAGSVNGTMTNMESGDIVTY